MEILRFFVRNRFSLHVGLKLLAAIVGIEFLIMTGIELSGFDHDSLWTGVADALLLGCLSSMLIYVWVVSPLKEARDQNSLFNTVVNNLTVGVVVAAPHEGELRIEAINPAFTKITGYTSEEVIGRHPRFLQGEDKEQASLEKARDALRQGKPVRTLVRNYRKDGSPFWNNLHLSPVLDAKGEVVRWIGLVDDVTKQEELRTRSDLLQRAVEQGDEAISVFDAQGIVEVVNPAFCNAVGALTEDELTGRAMWQWWDDTDKETDKARAAVRKGRAWHGRHRRRRMDGEVYEALTSISPVKDDHGVLRFSSVHRDITEINQMEEQLMHAQKMEAVGTLAGGIAHDFNNILAAMLGNLYLVERDVQDNPQALERLKLVEKQGYSAADVIRKLLTFARSGTMEKEKLNLRTFLEELASFFRPLIPGNIELVFDIAQDKMVIHGDQGRIQQALLNLLTNAQHSVEQKFAERDFSGGRITLRASIGSKRSGCQSECLNRGEMKIAEEGCVCIEVEDNGIGMDETTRNKVFEPYFTTKESDRGTGLGLPMVKGCIELHGGCMEVDSIPGEGALFRCWIPFLEASKQKESNIAEQAVVQLIQGNGELILIADDNIDALEALREMLEASGYRVICAVDGEEARQQFFAHQKELHAAFLDIVMPHCSGTVVAKYIYEERPDMPVVLMTGYDLNNTLVSEEFKLKGKVEVLAKPWNLALVNEKLVLIRDHYTKAVVNKS